MRYEINLPPGTQEEVIAWFEFMNGQNILAEQLTILVNQKISFMQAETDSPENQPEASLKSDCLMDNLFNWQEANQLILSEERKIKKKMLIV